jgi:hypothetical protein
MKEVLDKLIELHARCESRAGLSRSQEEFIERNHPLITGKPFTRRSCSNCYHDAVILMIVTLKKNGFMKNASRFTLKIGALLNNPGAGLPVVSNVNMTDELAIAHLRANPGVLKYFRAYPDNLEELLAGGDTQNQADEAAAKAAEEEAARNQAEKEAKKAAVAETRRQSLKAAREAKKLAAEEAKKQASEEKLPPGEVPGTGESHEV